MPTDEAALEYCEPHLLILSRVQKTRILIEMLLIIDQAQEVSFGDKDCIDSKVADCKDRAESLVAETVSFEKISILEVDSRKDNLRTEKVKDCFEKKN